LLAGYAKQEAKVKAEIIHSVARDLRLGVVAEEKNNGTRKQRRFPKRTICFGGENAARGERSCAWIGGP